MKRIIRKLTSLLTITLLLCACNQEDDVLEIFNSGVWNVDNFYSSVNWNTNSATWGTPDYVHDSDVNILREITIIFDENGTFTGNLSGGGTYSGKWEANASDRSVSITNVSTNISLSGKNKEYIDKLQSAKFYRGDSKSTLRLAPINRTTCIQFAHRKK